MDLFSQKILLVSGIASIFIITIFLLIVAIGIIMLVLVYQKKQLQYFREKEQLKVLFEKEILESKLEIQEQTLKNISQEIHDNIGQVLSLVKLNINTMSEATPQGLQEKILDSRHLVTKAIQDLRDLSRSLHTDYVSELGLIRSVEHELELIKKTGSLQTSFTIKGRTFRLEPQQELIIFRIVQEALHNVIRHAQASLIEVEMTYEPGAFILLVKDNGTGFDALLLTANNANGAGLGIRNMYNRAKLISSEFTLRSEFAKGTTLTLSLSPLTHHTH